MKKGLLAVTLLLVMGLLFGCAHTNAGTSPTPQTTAKDSPKVSAASQATASPKTAEPKATAASQKYEEKVEAMVPVFDSIARYLVEEDGIYDAKDSTCFWTVLYLLANNYGATDSLVTAVDGGLRFPKKLMQEYATACFSDYEDLLELPEGFTIEYDENYDADRKSVV